MAIEKKSNKGLKDFKSKNDFFNYLYNKEDLIWMGQNTNHLLINPDIEKALIEGAKKRDYCKYPPPYGFPELQKLILEDLDLDEDIFDVQIAASATDSLYLALSTVLSPITNAVASDPGYLVINKFCNRLGNHVKEVDIYNDECGYKLTPKLIKENVDEDTNLIVLVDPLNPIGGAYTKEEIIEIADFAIEHDLKILHDITYRDFADDHTLIANYAPENTITVYSFSKTYGMAGLRIGAVIASKELMQPIRSSIINDLGTNSLSQLAAIAALESDDIWIQQQKDICKVNQKIIKEAVDETPGTFIVRYPSDGNMLVIDISETGIKPIDLSDYLLKEKNIFIRDASYTSKKYADEFVRVSFSVPTEQVMEFKKVFKDSVEYLKKQVDNK